MKLFMAIAMLVAATTVSAQNQATTHAPDGGVISKLQSISIPPLTNAPFSATVTTEWTRLLPDGSKATVKNHRTIARDSSGRIFEERRMFTPTGDITPTFLQNLQYMDPNRHEIYDCNPAEKVCYVSVYRRPAMVKMPDGIDGARSCACGTPQGSGMTVKQEALGQKTIDDVEVIGSREIATIPAGAFGNDHPEAVVKEFWYSPRLGVNLIVQRFDPRSGVQNFAVSNISLAEPDTRTFQPPADYQILKAVGPRGMQ